MKSKDTDSPLKENVPDTELSKDGQSSWTWVFLDLKGRICIYSLKKVKL